MKKKTPELTKDKLSVEYDENDFENSLPNLAKELKDKEHWARVPINKLEREEDMDLDSLDENVKSDSNTEIELNEEDSEDIENVEFEDECEESDHNHSKSIITGNSGPSKSSGSINDLETEEIVGISKPKPLSKEEEQELSDPKVENFLCRCKTVDQAEDIIKYCLKRKEITPERAEELLNKIKKEGLRSFGEHKAWGHFERKYRRGSKDLDLTERSSE